MTSIASPAGASRSSYPQMRFLLAEKGSQTWSKEDQTVSDADSDEAERLQRQIAAHQKAMDQDAEDNFRDAPLQDRSAKKSETQGRHRHLLCARASAR